MTQFSFQVPIHNLDQFDGHLDYVFGLSFLCKYDNYFNYLKRVRSALGYSRTLILDNSFCELGCADNVDKLVELYNALKPDLLVSPDHHDWSLEKTFMEYDKLSMMVPPDNLLFVIRSDEFYDLAIQQCIPNLAVPYNYRPHYHYPRSKYAHGIVSDHVLRHPGIHFLGYNCPDEILEYKPSTCDTSMPVKLAKLGIPFESWLKLECPHVHNRHFPNLLIEGLSLNLTDAVIHNMKEIKCRS